MIEVNWKGNDEEKDLAMSVFSKGIRKVIKNRSVGPFVQLRDEHNYIHDNDCRKNETYLSYFAFYTAQKNTTASLQFGCLLSFFKQRRREV